MEEQVESPRNPQFHIGPYVVPAIILPIGVSLLFIAFKIYERKHPPAGWPPLLATEKLDSVQPSDPKSAADPENLKLPSTQKKAPASERITSTVLFIGFFIAFTAIIVAPIFSKSPSPHWTVVAAISAAALFATVFTYACFETGTSRTQGAAVSILSAAILTRTVLKQSLPWPWAFTAAISMVALVSWCPSTQASAQVQYSIISLLPLTLVLQTLLPQSWWYDESGDFDPASRWVSMPLVALILVWALWISVCQWLGLSPNDQKETKVYTAQEIRSDLKKGGEWLLSSGIILVAWFSFIALTSYTISCIGLTRLVLGTPNPPPSFKTNIGGSLATILACWLFARRPKDDSPQKFLYHGVDALGWPILGSLSLGLALMAVEQVRT